MTNDTKRPDKPAPPPPPRPRPPAKLPPIYEGEEKSNVIVDRDPNPRPYPGEKPPPPKRAE